MSMSLQARNVPEMDICNADMVPSQSNSFDVTTVRGCYAGKSKMYFAALAAYFGAVGMGTVLGYSSPALHDMEVNPARMNPSSSEGDWIGSIMALGALLGGIFAGPATDRFGRRAILIFSVIPFTAGWFSIAFARSVWSIIIGRMFTGFCCGVVSLTVPVYIAEIATPERRGLLGAGFQMMVCLGILVTYGVGSIISWVNLALFSACFPILMSGLMLVMPESPRWLISKSKRMEAAEAIYFLQGGTVHPEESCQEMQENFEQQPKGQVSFRELLQPHLVKPVGICLCIMLFQQWSGINGIMFYAAKIFKESGYDAIDPTMSSLILGTAQVGGTFVGMMITDKAGRKLLLLASSAFMILGLTALTVLYAMANVNDESFIKTYGWVDVASLSIYVFAFAIGYGPIPWLIMSELLPVRVKGMASSLATFFNWMNAFLVTNQFSNMLTGMNTYGAYLFYDIVCILGFVFVLLFLPETKGKSLEDIEALFATESDHEIESIN